MKTLARMGLSAAAAAFALGMVSIAASAQQDAKPAATTPATKPAETKAPSPCKGLDKTACAAKAECRWIEPKKAGKDGKKREPFCRLQATKKKVDKKK